MVFIEGRMKNCVDHKDLITQSGRIITVEDALNGINEFAAIWIYSRNVVTIAAKLSFGEPPTIAEIP